MVDRQGQTIDPVEQFPQHVIDTLSLMTPEGVRIPLQGGREHTLRATPAPTEGTQPLPWYRSVRRGIRLGWRQSSACLTCSPITSPPVRRRG